MQARTVRNWYRIHKWTSLVCTAFLLMACLTGLPLIFEHEMEDIVEPHVPASIVPAGNSFASLDEMVAITKTKFPSLHPDISTFYPIVG